MKTVTIMTAMLLVAVSYGLYQLSFEVEHLQDQATALERQIEEDKKALNVLEAEWALLNTPKRLEQLSNRFLDLTPTEPVQIKNIEDLAIRTDGLQGAAFLEPSPEAPRPAASEGDVQLADTDQDPEGADYPQEQVEAVSYTPYPEASDQPADVGPIVRIVPVTHVRGAP